MLANGNVETAVSNPFFLKKYFGDHHVHAILRCFFQGTAPGASEINGKSSAMSTSRFFVQVIHIYASDHNFREK
jgi:hypothetical protein